MPHFRRTVIVMALAAAACSSQSEPTGTAELRLSDTYVLRTIAGDELPAVFTDNDFVRQRIVADTLLLTRLDTGREVQVLEFLDKASGEIETYTATYDLTYSVDDGRIEVVYECNDVIILSSCIAPPHLAGLIGSNGILFDFALGRTPLAFERVTP